MTTQLKYDIVSNPVDFPDNLLDTYLYPQQRVAFDKCVLNNGGIVWMKPGTGKTRVGIFASMILSNAPVVFIVCRRVAFDDWRKELFATLQYRTWDVREIEECSSNQVYDIPVFILISDSKLRNHNTCSVIQQFVDKGKVGALILDEGYLFKNPKSIRSIAARNIALRVPTVLLSGSIMSRRDLVEIWGQLHVANKSCNVAKHLTEFRERYQVGMRGQWMSWYPKKGAYKQIMQKIEPFTQVYFPANQEMVIHESILTSIPTYEQSDYIRQLKHYAAIESEKINFELNNMATVIIKCQQISDGWVRTPDDKIEWIDSSKYDRCVALVSEIIESGERLVVWCAFREDIKRLHNAMSDIAPTIIFQSGERFDLERWSAPGPKICLATEASGSSVNHFAHTPYGIYYSQDWKWFSMQQSRDRHVRINSQHNETFYYYLHTEGSLDKKVYNVVQRSQQSEKSFIEEMEILQWAKQR